ncbi:MAG TPA: aminotransferase class IV [Acidimicrobiia bacterium]|nr:aminotransferase class IV [Acidimicrobiia bacterium]
MVWVDGALVAESEARISPFDHGLLTGDGVFETLRVYRGQPYCWRRHYERLARSASGMGLAIPPGPALRRAALDVIGANRFTDARLRITVTGGPSPLGSDRGRATPTLILAASPLGPPAPAPPTAVVTVPWPRNERGALAGLKTISYGENVRALAVATAAGAGEAIFANTRGELCEGTGTNVFVVADGIVRTPPEASGCLLGVTRNLILELAVRLDLPAREMPLPMSALRTADEAFLSSSTREVQAISSVDGHALPAAPGPVTTLLADAFRRMVADDLDP